MSAATEPLAWMVNAECRGMNPDLFMPARGDNAAVAEARKVCDRCPVRNDCLDYALANNEKVGIWGGFSERQRREMRRGRPKGQPVPDQIAARLQPGQSYNAEHIRVLIGHRSHSAVAPALRVLVADGRVVCVRPFQNSRLPALYQLAGGAGPS